MRDEDLNKEEFKLNPLVKQIRSLRQHVTDALTFYASYHQDPTNQKIHTLCIPLIVWTSMVWLSGIPFPLTDNVTNLLAIGYCLGYCLYDTKMGLASAAFLASFSITASIFAMNVPHAYIAALVLHGTSWAAQLYGHAKHEGNRPALLDSLLQSLYIAPLFSFIEACDFLSIKQSPLVTNSLFKQSHKASSPESQVLESTIEDPIDPGKSHTITPN